MTKGIPLLKEDNARLEHLIARCDANIETLKMESAKERSVSFKGIPPTRFGFVNGFLDRFGLLRSEITFQFSEEFIEKEINPTIAIQQEYKEFLNTQLERNLEKIKRIESDAKN